MLLRSNVQSAPLGAISEPLIERISREMAAWLLDALGESTLEKLGQHLPNHIPPHARESLVKSLVEVCEPRVVEA